MSEITNQCPKCASPMEQGFIMDKADLNFPTSMQWVQGEPKKSFWSGFDTTDKQIRVVDKILRCVRCGYLEFYASHDATRG